MKEPFVAVAHRRPGATPAQHATAWRAPMDMAWDLLVSGPADAHRSVLLLPGGLNPARSYAELMAEPALAGTRLVAATLPGHCRTAPPEDFSITTLARHTARLAARQRCDV